MKQLNYQETLEKLHSIPRRKKEENLDRMERLLSLLSNPHHGMKFIHVAGTNGKGSISRMLEEILLESGYKAGLFTSPYIIDFRERIQINNLMISEHDVCDYFEKVMNVSSVLEIEGLGTPSEFEVVTAMSFLYFRDQSVDIAIIEVGIGGLYDATNVIMPILSVITSINFDHMNILGSTLESIAGHKAGILKGSPAVSSSQQPEVKKVLKAKAKEVSSEIIFSSSREIKFLRLEGTYQIVEYHLKGHAPITVKLSLMGIHQMLNTGVVLYAAYELIRQGFTNITEKKIQTALVNVRWPGRMEIISVDPLIVIDGAHNLDGAINLKESMAFYFRNRKIILILGMLRDKDVDSVSRVLSMEAKKIILVTPDDFRAMKAEDLMQLLDSRTTAETADSFKDAVLTALAEYKEGDVILTAGSLYTIGDAKNAFLRALSVNGHI